VAGELPERNQSLAIAGLFANRGLSMTVRAKFFCQSIQKAEDDSYRTIHMSPVTADAEENEAWSKYTPGGLNRHG
jgi:hypothetical protein